MEITPWTIYLWQLADNLGCAAFIAGVFLGFYYCMMRATENYVSKAVPWGIGLSLATSLLTPSSKTIAMMIVIPAIADSKVIQQDVPDLYNAAVEAIKDQLKKKD